MEKAARFIQSNQHSVPDSPTNGVSLVGEASARRSRWKKRTPDGQGSQPNENPFSSRRFSSSREKTRALQISSRRCRLIAMVWLFFQGMPHHLAHYRHVSQHLQTIAHDPNLGVRGI